MNTLSTTQNNPGISLRSAAITAGIGILVMAILAPVANFSILQKLILPDDAAGTYHNIIESEYQIRMVLLCNLVVAILDIVVAWALYVFLRPVNKSLSMLAGWFRIIYATLLVAVLLQLINVLQLIGGAEYLTAFEPDHLHARVMLSLTNFFLGWNFSMIIFGLHLLIIGYLMFRAGFMKRILGVLLIVASVGYLVDGFGQILSPSYNVSIALYTFFGEIVLIFWLLIKGGRGES